VIVALTAIAWITYRDMSTGITTSAALDGAPPSIGADQNILIIGLDSRRDQQGKPLPKDILDAMHAGDESSGSYDADVLIVLHMPAGDGPVTAVSIPRDDYVDLPGFPTSEILPRPVDE
jgi:anionic cell wall polymer biosynthesis LytR-Cps2A-Psr (LCP) family protein